MRWSCRSVRTAISRRWKGPIEARLGHTAEEFVGGFEKFADEETASAVREGVRNVFGGSAHSVVIAGMFLGTNEERHGLELIVLSVLDEDGVTTSVDVVARDRPPVSGGAVAPNENEAFELFMEATSKRLLGEPSSAAIDESLAGLGQFFDLDRVAVNGYDDHEKVFASSASWTRDGVEPLEVETSGISISKLPWAYALLTAGEAVVISDGVELPVDAAAEKSLYMDAGVKSAVLVPIVYNDSLAGFVSLQAVAEDRSWSDPEVLRVRRFVAALSASLARNALVEELDKATVDAEDAKAAAEAATHQLADAKATAEEATGQLDVAKAAAAEAGRELEETRERAEVAQRRAEDTAADTLQVRDQLEQARAEIDEARRDVADVRAKLAEAEHALAEAGSGTAAAEPSTPETVPDLDAEDVAPVPPLDVRDLSTPEVADFVVEVEADAPLDLDIVLPDDEEEDIVAGEVAAPVDPSELETAEVAPLADEIEGVVPDPVAEMDVDSGDAGDEEADAGALDGAATPALYPDAAPEASVPEFDPDATLEMERGDRPADHGAPIEEPESGEADLPRALDLDEILERTQSGSKPEGEALAAEIEETIEVPSSRFFDAPEEPDAESTDEHDAADAVEDTIQLDSAAAGEVDADMARDLEAARQLAKQVVGKDTERSEDGDDTQGSDEDRRAAAGEFDATTEAVEELTGEFDAATEAVEELTGEFDALAEEPVESPEEPVESPEAPVEPPEAPVESGFPGLDTVAGVSEIAGDADLYRNLLIKFRQDYKSAPEKIGKAIEKGNAEVAHLLLHAIKGVAGVLGAAEVRDHAETLESALLAQDTAATQQTLALFSDALTLVIQSIDRIEAGADLSVGPAPGEIEAHVSDPKVLRTYLEGLRQHLNAEKPKQCQLVIREITARTWPRELNERVDRLAARVRADQFEEARNEFDALMAKLN